MSHAAGFAGVVEMTVCSVMRPVIAGAFLVLGVSVGAAPAQAPSLIALNGVERGQWQLREVGGTSRSVCIADAATLIQLRSRSANCSRFVIENTPSSATVHYTCPGVGHGRTTIAVETPRLMRIDSQGIDGGAPFAVDIEARRTGPCGQ